MRYHVDRLNKHASRNNRQMTSLHLAPTRANTRWQERSKTSHIDITAICIMRMRQHAPSVTLTVLALIVTIILCLLRLLAYETGLHSATCIPHSIQHSVRSTTSQIPPMLSLLCPPLQPYQPHRHPNDPIPFLTYSVPGPHPTIPTTNHPDHSKPSHSTPYR